MKQKYELSRVSGAPVADEELLSDLRNVAQIIGQQTVPQKKYGEIGKYDYSTLIRRFGSWNKALRKAGLRLSNEIQISDERLFENILNLWQHLGRQPRRSDLENEVSEFSQSPYKRRFGSWMAALESFVAYTNASEAEPREIKQTAVLAPRRTGRDPSLRLRFKVLQRDRFSCQQCGASPAKSVNVELHVDHVVPWSKGGETTLNNLQTLCAKCNLGKGNLG
ncbi:MAG TPA: HNH endonuclease [Candidatus Methylomirabilis sp.]|nr:HNH endonuclease [Candidatus Methylomirabilis sp.]